MEQQSISKRRYLNRGVLFVLFFLICMAKSISQQDRMADSITALLPTLAIGERIELLGDLCYDTSTSDFKASLLCATSAKMALNSHFFK